MFLLCTQQGRRVATRIVELISSMRKLLRDAAASSAKLYPHMPILRPHAARFHERRISSVTFMSAHPYGNVYMQVGVARVLADSSDFGFLGSKVHLRWTPMNRRAKVYAASFILGGEILNRRNTNKQTVTDISTPCLSASCVDNNQRC